MVGPVGRRIRLVRPQPAFYSTPPGRPRPDAELADGRPPERAEEERLGRGAREREHARGAHLLSLALVLSLQLDEDAATARRGVRDRVHRKARRVQLAAEDHGVE